MLLQHEPVCAASTTSLMSHSCLLSVGTSKGFRVYCYHLLLDIKPTPSDDSVP